MNEPRTPEVLSAWVSVCISSYHFIIIIASLQHQHCIVQPGSNFKPVAKDSCNDSLVKIFVVTDPPESWAAQCGTGSMNHGQLAFHLSSCPLVSKQQQKFGGSYCAFSRYSPSGIPRALLGLQTDRRKYVQGSSSRNLRVLESTEWSQSMPHGFPLWGNTGEQVASGFAESLAVK